MTEARNPAAPNLATWYAIQTRYRFERKVTTQLQGQGWQTFLPQLKAIHRWSDRQKRVETPLFPGYTFVRLDPPSLVKKQFLKNEGIIGLITFGGTPSPVPDRQIDDLRKLLSQDVPCSLHPFLQVGQKVRIRGGCLDGLEGILEEAGHKKLVISIDSIQRAVAIRIEGYELQLI
ncbi:MAG TPA: UpxY family transcription antiterminator [Terriglobales bacterium]|nr:UpxY family transcription antiterminator [Terriglobales bacterium]